jgi:hypothetical protein
MHDSCQPVYEIIILVQSRFSGIKTGNIFSVLSI